MYGFPSDVAREAHAQSFGPNSGYLSSHDGGEPGAGGGLWNPPSATTSLVPFDDDGDRGGVMVLSVPSSSFVPGTPQAPTEALQRYGLPPRDPPRPAPVAAPAPRPPQQQSGPAYAAPPPPPPPPAASGTQVAFYVAAAVLGGLLLALLVGSALVRCGAFGRKQQPPPQPSTAAYGTDAMARGALGWGGWA